MIFIRSALPVLFLLLLTRAHAQEQAAVPGQTAINLKNYPQVRLVFNNGTSACGYYDSVNNILYDCAGKVTLNKFMEVERRLPALCCNDADGDGVNDEEDKCINDKGPVTNLGCPQNGVSCVLFFPPDSILRWEKRYKDTDGDGVNDDADKCELTPGPANNFGCPVVDVNAPGCGVEKKHLYFATGSSRLSPEAVKRLKDLVAILKDNAELFVKFVGYTDNIEASLKLSKTRAAAAKNYLLSAGIDKSRIQTEGLGPKNPLVTNSTKAGRATNMHVEIFLTR